MPSFLGLINTNLKEWMKFRRLKFYHMEEILPFVWGNLVCVRSFVLCGNTGVHSGLSVHTADSPTISAWNPPNPQRYQRVIDWIRRFFLRTWRISSPNLTISSWNVKESVFSLEFDDSFTDLHGICITLIHVSITRTSWSVVGNVSVKKLV